jgi:dienelactone hydrolase
MGFSLAAAVASSLIGIKCARRDAARNISRASNCLDLAQPRWCAGTQYCPFESFQPSEARMQTVGLQVSVASGAVALEGLLGVPTAPRGVVIFSHGSGSGRRSPRNRLVAAALAQAGLATLLLDLLTAEEDLDYSARFDIALLTERLADAVRYVQNEPRTRGLRVGLFGASTGAASALRVAAGMPAAIAAVVSRGGRPDLAGDAVLRLVQAPTLLIVGGEDHEVIRLNRAAERCLQCETQLAIVPAATHLFEEPGALEAVAQLARQWFLRYLADL